MSDEVAETMDGADNNKAETVRGGNLGSYRVVPHALYRGTMSFDPPDGKAVGTTEADIALFWDAFIQGRGEAGSAHRAEDFLCRLVVFEVPKLRGMEQKWVTYGREKCVVRDGVETPRSLDDYTFSLDLTDLPEGMVAHVYEGRAGKGGKGKFVDPVYGLPTNPETRKIGVFYFIVTMSNPNGDPQGAGAPRTDDDDYGIITPACVKRNVRDYAATSHGKPLYIARDSVEDLNAVQARFLKKPDQDAKPKKGKAKEDDKAIIIDSAAMCAEFIDIRLFGGMVPKADRKMRGPWKVSHMISITPIEVLDIGWSRVTGHDREKVKRGAKPAPTAEAK
mgnify:CR=1 FL=1